MPHLVAPDSSLQAAWLAAHAEWGPGSHEDGFGLEPSDDVESASGFAAWAARLLADNGPAGCTYRWIVDDGGAVLGGIALRHAEHPMARWAGHLGFGVRPTARRRGLANWALGQMLERAWTMGMDRVLLVCAADNVASARTIERGGGRLEGIVDTELGPARRYWIAIGS